MPRLIIGSYAITGNRLDGWWVHRVEAAPSTGRYALTLAIATRIAQELDAKEPKSFVEVVESHRELDLRVNHDVGCAVGYDYSVTTLRCTYCGDEQTFKGMLGMIQRMTFENDHQHPVVAPPELDVCASCQEHATFRRAPDGSLESECCSAHPINVD